jgi:DNA-binding NtrC family response regulator
MPTEPSFKSPSGAAKVLLVDDDNAIRFSLGKILEHHGFNVSSASNVSDALRLISSDSFDVLLSDLHMPGPGDGLTVVRETLHKFCDRGLIG